MDGAVMPGERIDGALPLAGCRIGLLTAAASRLGGGVFEAVVAQAALIRSLGGTASVFALADRHSAEDRGRFASSAVTDCPVVGPARFGYAPDLVPALLEADLDCLHLHGIWMYPSRAAGLWARCSGRPLMISPHGMLDPWITARGRWQKAVARLAYERGAWRAAHALHALTRREAGDIAHESGRTDAVVIPNAGPEPLLASGPRPPLLLYIGRIHPKKNLLALVQAWGSARRPESARLVIGGWGSDTDVARLRAAIAACGAPVEFVGPVFGEAKAELLARARFVILPSLSEGLPMAMLEAWAAGAPTIMTEACSLAEGFAANAALETGHDVAALRQALERAFALDEPGWAVMSNGALGLARDRFAPARVGAQWAEAYAGAIAASAAGRPIPSATSSRMACGRHAIAR